MYRIKANAVKINEDAKIISIQIPKDRFRGTDKQELLITVDGPLNNMVLGYIDEEDPITLNENSYNIKALIYGVIYFLNLYIKVDESKTIEDILNIEFNEDEESLFKYNLLRIYAYVESGGDENSNFLNNYKKIIEYLKKRIKV